MLSRVRLSLYIEKWKVIRERPEEITVKRKEMQDHDTDKSDHTDFNIDFEEEQQAEEGTRQAHWLSLDPRSRPSLPGRRYVSGRAGIHGLRRRNRSREEGFQTKGKAM